MSLDQNLVNVRVAIKKDFRQDLEIRVTRVNLEAFTKK